TVGGRGRDFQWRWVVGALVLASLALLAVPSAVGDPPPIKIQGTPEDQTVEATSAAGGTLTWAAPTATSDTDGTVPVTCSPDSGSTFPLGVTKVTCTASDSTGFKASKSFNVTVVDTTPPEVSVPSDITVPATVPSGAAVTFSASASDAVDGSISASCSPPSGSTFAIGTATGKCTATGSHGNTGSASFGVTVQDTTAPTFSGVPSAQVVEADGPKGARASYTVPTASD